MKELYVKDGELCVTPNSTHDAQLIVENVLSLARKTDSTKVKIDLTELNMFDALTVATVTAARGLTQSLKNRYEFIVNNNVLESQINLLCLSNLKVTLVAPKSNTINIFSKRHMA